MVGSGRTALTDHDEGGFEHVDRSAALDTLSSVVLNRNVDLPIRIASWRRAKGLTQREIATAAGVGVSAVSMWETGQTSPSSAHLQAVVAKLGISMARFYGRVPKARVVA